MRLVIMRMEISVLTVPNPMIVVGVLIIVMEVFMLVMGVFMDLMGVLVVVMGVLMYLPDLAGMFVYVIPLLCKVILIVGSIVRSAGVDVEFNAGDPSTSLALEMQVAIAQVQFCKLPFKCRRGDSQIG
jgi:hypothetical protein